MAHQFAETLDRLTVGEARAAFVNALHQPLLGTVAAAVLRR